MISNTAFFIASLEPLVLEGNLRLAAAIFFGIVLGMLIIKINLADDRKVKDSLTLKDVTLAALLLLSLGIGIVVFYLLRDVHMVQSHTPDVTFYGALLGGILAGVGVGICGLTPVTAAAALGSGRLYSLWVLIGMVLAFPAIGLLKKYLGDLIARFAEPMASSLEPSGGLWSFNSPVLWVAGICIVLGIFIYLLGPKAK